MVGRVFLSLFVIFYSPWVVASEVMDVWQNNWAVDQLSQKKFLQAHENFNELLSRQTFHPVFQFNLGFSFFSLGEVNKAIKMYKEILKLEPLPPEIEFSSLYNLGVLYHLLLGEEPTNLDRALHFYQKALKFKPDSKKIKTNIELLFRGSGGKGSKRKNQRNKNGEQGAGGPVTNKPDKGQKDQKKYKVEKMSKKDVERILNELKNRSKVFVQNIKEKNSERLIVKKAGDFSFCHRALNGVKNFLVEDVKKFIGQTTGSYRLFVKFCEKFRQKKLFMGLFVFFGFFSFPLWAEVKVTASVDSNQLFVGDVFTLQVSLSSDQSIEADTHPSPAVKRARKIHSWVNRQTHSSVYNSGAGVKFKTLHKTNYNFQCEVMRKGQVIIEPIAVRVKNKTYFTKKIVINALPARKKAKRSKSKRSSKSRPGGFKFSKPGDIFKQFEEQFDSLFKSPFGNSNPFNAFPDVFTNGPGNPEDTFFIVAKTDKKEVFKGEQLLVSWFLYTQGRVRNIDTLKYPTLKGFWKEDIHLTTHLQYEKKVIRGVSYNRALLASYALFPMEEGPAIIDSYKAKVTITGFNLRNLQTTKSSAEIPITIKPLPLEGRLSHFSGGVGKFQMRVGTSSRSIVTHQPFSLKVRFEGYGNAKFIELPKLPIGSDLEIYDIKNESRFFKNGQSFKEFEVLLIPRQPGEIMIGELRTSYFDPERREYISVNSKPIRLTVLPGAKQGSIGEERLKSEEKKKTLPPIIMEWNPEFEQKPSYLFIWIFVGILGLMILLTKWVIDLGFFIKKVSLEDLIHRRFNRMEVLLVKSRWKDLGVEATNTVYHIMGHISGQRGASEEIDGVLAKTAPSVRREIEESLRKLMDFFGLLGFGPKSFVHEFKDSKQVKAKLSELKKLLLKASHLIKETDDSDREK